MPAPAGTKRVKGKRISRDFIIGSEAWPLNESNRPPNTPADHTTGWRVYVKNREGGADIRTWLQKVQFKIYHTYENPHRMIEHAKDQCFEIRETGWGGFNVDIRMYFQPAAHEKPQYRQHFLQLEHFGNEEQRQKQKDESLIRSEICDTIEFNEPTEALFDAMTSEHQWDYLNKDKGKGKKGAGNFGYGRSVEPPETSTPSNPYSKEMERSQLQVFTAAEKLLEKLMAEEQKKREDVQKRRATMLEEEKKLSEEIAQAKAAKAGKAA